MKSKTAQFFLVSIILILISMFYVYLYIRSADLSTTMLFERSSTLDMQNVVDSIKTRNNLFFPGPESWWHIGWYYRKNVSVNVIVGADPPLPVQFEFNPDVPADKLLSGDCQKELRLTDAATPQAELNSDVSSATLPCNITMTETLGCAGTGNPPPCTITRKYYVYYGNATALAPSYRIIAQAAEYTPTLGAEETEAAFALCRHFGAIYPRTGAFIDCKTLNNINVGTVAERRNYSVYYASPSLKFNGTIN